MLTVVVLLELAAVVVVTAAVVVAAVVAAAVVETAVVVAAAVVAALVVAAVVVLLAVVTAAVVTAVVVAALVVAAGVAVAVLSLAAGVVAAGLELLSVAVVSSEARLPIWAVTGVFNKLIPSRPAPIPNIASRLTAEATFNFEKPPVAGTGWAGAATLVAEVVEVATLAGAGLATGATLRSCSRLR